MQLQGTPTTRGSTSVPRNSKTHSTYRLGQKRNGARNDGGRITLAPLKFIVPLLFGIFLGTTWFSPSCIPIHNKRSGGSDMFIPSDKPKTYTSTGEKRSSSKLEELPLVQPGLAGGSTNRQRSTPPKGRIDLKSCHLSSRPLLAAKVDKLRGPNFGLGHKMTQFFSVMRFALVNGYCLCFDRDDSGSTIIQELFDLQLAALLNSCPSNATRVETTIKDLKKDTEENPDAMGERKIIFHVYMSVGEVWTKKFAPNGHGDVISFIDSFFRDNRIVEDMIYPHYLASKEQLGRGNAFLPISPASSSSANRNVINAAFHIRVGDNVLESDPPYWKNLLGGMREIVDMERGKDAIVHLYLVYFDKRAGKYGAWTQPSDENQLPHSHAFLANLCKDMHSKNIECFWKRGTNDAESIDMMVTADLIYVSGSSYSQILSLFNGKGAIKLYAVPKELNFHGDKATKDVPFLSTHTTAFSSLGHYYINPEGALYQEQLAYLNLEHRNRSKR